MDALPLGAPPARCRVAPPAEGFGRCQEEIIAEWRSPAGRLPGERRLDRPTITNHLPDVIAEITRDLALNRAGATFRFTIPAAPER